MHRKRKINIARIHRNDVNNNKSAVRNVRNIGPSLRICQVNVEGMSRAKGEYLSKLSVDENVDVLVIQETHTETLAQMESRGKIEGFNLIGVEFSRVHGIATYAKQNITDVRVVESNSNGNIYSSTIRTGRLSITNVYKSPMAQWTDTVLNVQPHPAVYVGDFNSHHSEWGYSSDDINGELVVNWASNNELQLIHDAKDRKTFHSKVHGTESNPDLCFVSADSEGFPLSITRKVLPAFPRSQHRPIILEVGLSIPIVTSVPRPRWNFRKANWTQFSTQLDSAIRFIPPIAQNYRFNNLVINTAKKCVPRGYRKEYIPCWEEDADRLYAEFQETEDPEVAKELLKSLDIARKQRWIETVESIDLSHSSRQGWSLIRKLGGASKLMKTSSAMNADRVARRLVQSSKAPADKQFSRRVNRMYKALRKTTPRYSDISRQFSIVDINDAIVSVKNGKASGFDGIYPEFLTFSGPRTRLWLARFFSNVLSSNRLPPAFKKTKIIALLKPNKPEDLPDRYRPIALLSVVYKFLERLIFNRIESEIDKLTPSEQAGFRKNRSCAEQVLSLTNHIESGFQIH